MASLIKFPSTLRLPGIIYEAIVEASAPPGFKANAFTPPTTDALAGAAAPTFKKDKKIPKKQGEDDEEEIDDSQVGILYRRRRAIR